MKFTALNKLSAENRRLYQQALQRFRQAWNEIDANKLASLGYVRREEE